MSSLDVPPPPASRAVKIGALVVVLLGTLGLFAAAEWAVRLRSASRNGFQSLTELYARDPVIGHNKLRPNVSGGRLTSNAAGYRGPLPERPKPAGRVRFAFLGGSTTICHEVSSDEHVWPHLVTKAVAAAYPARQVDYLNASAGGWYVEIMHNAWRAEVKSFAPDVVFIYEGTNDLSLDARALAAEQGLDGGEGDAPDRQSWLAQRSLLVNLVEKNLAIKSRQEAASGATGKVQFDAEVLSRGFKKRLRALVDDIEASGALPVLVTFSPRVRADQSLEEQQAAMVTLAFYCPFLSIDGAIRGFDAYNARMREVAQEAGVPLIGGEHLIPGDGVHFADSVHFTDVGAAKMADRVASAFLALPEARQLLAATATVAAVH